MSVAYFLYQCLGWLALPLAAPLLLWRALRDPRYRVGWAQRLGFWGRVPRGGIWVHGASVGEVRAAAPLVRELLGSGEELVLSTTSPAGREAAAELLGSGGAARLLPLDLALLVRRVLRRVRPRALIVIETEIWPSLLQETDRAGVPILLINGRISDRALPRYRKVRRWIGPLLRRCAVIHAQSERDMDRFRELGAPRSRLRVGGNLKFDLPAPDAAEAAVTALRHARADGWRIWVAGSTHPGEEEAVLDAVAQLEAAGERIALVLAPRHLERTQEVMGTVAAAGNPAALWSELATPAEEGILRAFRNRQPLLVDRYGLLQGLYGGAECAFVGGTLAPVGGHNLLEPLNWGVPVVFGPHTENAPEIRDEVVRRELGRQVHNAEELGQVVAEYLQRAELREGVSRGAEELFAANRGAVQGALRALHAVTAQERRQ